MRYTRALAPPQRPAPWRDLAPALFLGAVLLAAVGALAVLRDIAQHAPLAIAAYTLMTVAAILATNLLWNRDDCPAVVLVLAVGLLARLLLFLKLPFLSSDAYRYLWDGRLLLHGIDPYIVTPADPRLHSMQLSSLYQHIDWRNVPSLYPPLGLALFALTVKIGHLNVLVMKALMELGDVLTLALLVRLLRVSKLPRGRVVFYAWCPLVIVEFAWSAHLEAWCLAALAFALLMHERKKLIATAFAVAAAVLIKLYPAAAVPVLFPRRPWMPLVWVVGIIAGAYAPFMLWNPNVLGFLPQFATHYHFNQSLHGILPSPWIAPLFVSALAAVVWARRAGLGLAESLSLLFAAYFVLSPTVNPWYLTVFALLMPLVTSQYEGVLAPLLQGIQLWVLLAVLGYAGEAVPAARFVEYAPLFIGAGWSALRLLWHAPPLQALGSEAPRSPTVVR